MCPGVWICIVSCSHYQICRWRKHMHSNICSHSVEYTDGVHFTASAWWRRALGVMRGACDVLTVCDGAVRIRTAGLAASTSHADGGDGRCGFTSLSSCLYGGSGIYLSVSLSDSPPWRVEVCDREMERDGGWTGRVRAHCLCNEYKWAPGLTLWKQARGGECVGWRRRLLLSSLSHTHGIVHAEHAQSHTSVSVLVLCFCSVVPKVSDHPNELLVRLSAR